eukprot:CAMPEP_0197037040 /NCGR_PEP_ID=MMETSP1384-20130603/14356_1 /TAXON_ID=29189 /ORGANISM="Ammonia sp." /LENGTH=704 /DNA_ID=CAMNT_0042467291 /DNA_START=41 /DNA_END=2155 /DNA_ORIENTATION=+
MSTLNIQRFGEHGESATQSGQSRLNKYLKRLQQNDEPITTHHANHNEADKKRKLAESGNDSVSSPPHKKLKRSLTPPPTVAHCLSFEDNLNEQCINSTNASSHSLATQQNHNALQTTERGKEEDDDDDDDEEDDNEQKEEQPQQQHHPLYKLTAFPEVALPEIVDPEKTLMPKPIWMEKGNKIISDITDGSSAASRADHHSLNSLRLDARLIATLKSEGYASYFSVQKNVIPAVIRGAIQKRDIAVCAPTGSGKTLAYVLPICHTLCKELSESTHRLRALVVSPSRDLALQIYLIFEKFAKSVGLKIGLSAGQTSLREEQQMMIGTNSLSMYRPCSSQNTASDGNGKRDQTGIDILVCTPGRLVDHLNHTQGFTLQSLQYLVLDEADRLLLEGIYQDWLFRLNQVLESRQMIERHKFETAQNDEMESKAMEELPTYNGWVCLSSRKSRVYEYKPYLLKILLSATLTHDPKIISSLKLNDPMYFAAATDKEYLIPASIEQYFVACKDRDKLAYFLALIDSLHQHKKMVVCFCQTVETAHRLKRMVEIAFNVVHEMESLKIAEFSRLVAQSQRPRILRQFRANKIQLLICSDAMARGLDVACLDCVINYECPRNVENYVHRIGRTARGIGEGTAFTFMSGSEETQFTSLLQECVENGTKLKAFQVNEKSVAFHQKHMRQYRQLLTDALSKEENGELQHNAPYTINV